MPTALSLERARALRLRQTNAEARLWGALRDRRLGGWKWRRQAPRGRYIVDFLSAEASLVVELDGSQHQEQAAEAYDARRTAWLINDGLRVLRFESREIMVNLEGVQFDIWTACGGDRAEKVPSSGPSGHLLPRGAKGETPETLATTTRLDSYRE
jgi:very-short-patch-repair endonuclease